VFADQPITADTVWQWIDNLRIPSCRDIEQSKSEKQSEWRLLEMTPVEIVACLYDWIADQYTAAARQMGCPIKSIAFSGGAIAKNMALRQVLADRFAVPVTDAVYDVMAGMRLLALNAEASIVN
jgi:predicted RNase H-like nuclease